MKEENHSSVGDHEERASTPWDRANNFAIGKRTRYRGSTTPLSGPKGKKWVNHLERKGREGASGVAGKREKGSVISTSTRGRGRKPVCILSTRKIREKPLPKEKKACFLYLH